ncbi:MAG: hypothetical protein FJ100_22170, partial [Deltaproteobacteria bacterium]|nr:hypothetical protein [Deltaproteobacteria bacterium]
MERNDESGAARRALRWAALAALALFVIAACGVEGPNVGCTQDSQCGANRLCKNKVCVSPDDKDCAADTDCAASLWSPAGKATTCQAAKCVEKLCKLVNAATDTLCEDGDALPCTSGQCDAAGKCNVPLVPLVDKDQCLIAGACHATSASDPASGDDAKCRLCNPTQSQTAWSPRPAGSPCPDDKFGCTPDVCDAKGACTHAIPADNCAFDGQCWKKGTLKEKEECVGCNPAVSQTGWSNMGTELACKDDGKPCTDDKCDGKGACGHAPTAAGTACTEDDGKACTIEQCDGKGACGHDKVANDSCHIDGICMQGGTVNPKNPCQKCAPGVSQSAWSPVSAGVACTGDTLECTDETCDGAGKCGGAKVKGNACLIDVGGKPTCFGANLPIDPAAPCVICDPGNTKTAPTTLSDNTACEAGAPCLLGKCSKGVCQSKGPKPNTCYVEADSKCAQADEVDPKNPCQACAPQTSQTAWTHLPKDTSCTADATVCTVDVCDGKGLCTHNPDNGKCADKGGLCMTGVCDAGLGCIGVPKPVTATCEGADGIACTVEHCDGKGACAMAGAATDSLCDDKVGCTLDVCDAKKGCVFTPDNAKCSDGNECTADQCDAKTGCSNPPLTDGVACTKDKLPCTQDQCKAGACAAPIPETHCVIGGVCVAANASSDLGCKECKPLVSQTAWTNATTGKACEDGSACTSADGCEAGVCKGAPVVCDDKLPCTLDSCDSTTGCFATDSCPWGHACDSGAKACLTEGGKPLELVVSDGANGQNPNPTNPAVIAHDWQSADGQLSGQRVWVLWQSDAAQMVENGGWVIKNPAGKGVALRALALEPQKAAVGKKQKPEVVTMPQAGFFGGSKTVVQGFAVVAKDPQVAGQSWVGWLEGDPANVDATKKCLNGAAGGVVRLARLDAKTGKGVVDVAGEVCVGAVNNVPAFLTAGFAVLDGAESELGAAAARKALWLRPEPGSSGSWGSALALRAGAVGSAKSIAVSVSGTIAPVHPVLVDMGPKAASAERFLAVGVTEKAGQFGLWVQGISDKGVDT